MSIDVVEELSSHGSRGAIVPFSRVEDIKQDMADLRDGVFHTDWLDRMVMHVVDDSNKFLSPDINFEPRSLISVVTPSPKAILRIVYKSEAIEVVVPPLYTDWHKINDGILHYLTEYLEPHGYSAVMAKTFPQKLLAVHSGLGLYGRNNLFYHDEFGSYARIMTYVTDLPSEDNAWYPLRRMDQCSDCYACANACPTKAIEVNRRIIDHDRCLTRFNEPPGKIPGWIDKGAHNCIIGCIRCQDCCPSNFENKKHALHGVEFSEEETSELLDWQEGESFSSALATKLEMTGIPSEYISVLPRNLAVLLSSR